MILPVLLLLTLGVVDTTRVLSLWISITNGVREGALYASEGAPPGTYTDTAGITTRIMSEATGLDPASVTIDAPSCDNGTCNAASRTVTIRATYQMSLLLPFVQVLLGDPVTITAEATAPIIDHST